MTDAELVRQTRKGQPSAYEDLVRRWSARLIAYVRSRVGHPDVAEDIAQDTLLKAYRHLDSLSEPEKFGSWLLSIAHRSSLDWLKARGRATVSLGDMTDGMSDGVASGWESAEHRPADACIRKEECQSVMGAINALPQNLREVLMMYYYEDVTYRDLAEMLGVSAATVNARLTKARNLLRKQLSDPRSLR